MFRRRPVGGVATAARVVVQRTPEALTLVRRRAQPTAATASLAGLTASEPDHNLALIRQLVPDPRDRGC
jgi:hypothetical protein